jgi:hypothetical protein
MTMQKVRLKKLRAAHQKMKLALTRSPRRLADKAISQSCIACPYFLSTFALDPDCTCPRVPNTVRSNRNDEIQKSLSVEIQQDCYKTPCANS